jgi:hypothetical protein
MHRFGYTEECYFDFTFSPIKEPNGSVGGIFNAVLEATFRTLSERRAKTLSDIAAKAAAGQTAEEICRLASSVLEGNPSDVPFSLLYLSTAETEPLGTQLQLVASSGINTSEAELLSKALNQGPIGDIAQSGKPQRLDDLSSFMGEVRGKAWPEKIESADFPAQARFTSAAWRSCRSGLC